MSKKKFKVSTDFFSLIGKVKYAWGAIIVALVVSLVQSVVTSMVPDATANLFDGDFSSSKLWPVAGTLILTLIASAVANILLAYAENKSALMVKNSTWERMMNVKADYFDDKDPNSILSLVTFDAPIMAGGLVKLIVGAPALLLLVGMCALQLSQYSPKLLQSLLFLIPIYVVYMIFMAYWQFKLGREVQLNMGRLTGYLAERIRNLSMIKMFLMQPREETNGKNVAGQMYRTNTRYYYVYSAGLLYASVANVASVVIATVWGAALLKAGEIDVPAFVAFSTYVATINTTMYTLASMFAYVNEFDGRAYRIARLFEAEREETDTQKGVIEIPDGDIAFKHVSFNYKEGEPVLSDISLTIPYGKITALVGPSGSGKTSILKLLERLYAPQDGEITIGGIDLGEMNVQALRCKMAYVVQDAGIFGGKLRDCLIYGSNREITDEELDGVCAKVGLTELVKALPEGYDTEIAERGSSLSGGQRQRIVIARALLRNADILLFDEPTSALDANTANEISRMIFRSFPDKTVVIVSHELNYVTGADHIAVINKGELVGTGNHKSLMETCNVYRELVEEQSYQEVFNK